MLRIHILVFFVLTAVYGSEGEPTIKSDLGKIVGETKNIKFRGTDYTVDTYLGIPYAKAPTGELRFKKPVPYGKFSSVFEATAVPPACPQYDFMFKTHEKEAINEDCLFLNVYVPRQSPDQSTGHAVLFFIHGGGFNIGSGNMYRGEVLASQGNVIVVTINYRMGLLGFMDMDDPSSPGNYGFLDQRLALQWVNKNIGAFGGDKDRVTIFGESAGAVSVSVQMLYPQNKGLFRGAIAESGTLTMPLSFSPNNIEVAKHYADSMNCNAVTSEAIVSCLKNIAADDIINIYKDGITGGDGQNMMKVSVAPTIDGEFLKMKPAELFEKSKTEEIEEIKFFRKIKLINGMNSAEGTMFLLMQQAENLDNLEVTREQMNDQHVPGVAAMVYGFGRTIPESVKQMIIAEYTDWTNPDDPKTIRNQAARIYGDTYFTVPAIEMSRIHANASDVDSFVYVFDASISQHPMPTPSWMEKANHGDEVGPVFGYHFDFEKYFNLTDYAPSDWEWGLSSRMMIHWSNFAKSGDPNKPVSSADSSVLWPKYSLDTQEHIIYDREDSLGSYPYARETDFWRNILPAVFDEIEHAQTITAQFSGTAEGTCDKDGGCN